MLEQSEPTSVVQPKFKSLPKAREQLKKEFQLKDSCLKLIDNQLGQEPYNMVRGRGRDGTKPSTRWSRTIEQIWTWNNGVPDEKGRRHFKPVMTVDGHTFYRRDILQEPVFRADLVNLLRSQFKSLGYERVFTKPIRRTEDGEEYETLMVNVPVSQ